MTAIRGKITKSFRIRRRNPAVREGSPATCGKTLFLVVFAACTWTPSVFGDPQKAASAPAAHFADVREKMELAAKNKDVKGLVSIGDQLEVDWEKGSRDDYGLLMKTLIGTLASDQLDGDQQFKAARRFTILALSKGEELTLSDEINLVQRVQSNPRYTADLLVEPWPKEREKEMKLWFHAINRLEASIDPTWINSPPPAQASVPKGVAAGFSGMTPDRIQDPELRAEYVAAIHKLRQERERYDQQSQSRELERYFLRRAKAYIVSSYSTPPFAPAELKAFLDISIPAAPGFSPLSRPTARPGSGAAIARR